MFLWKYIDIFRTFVHKKVGLTPSVDYLWGKASRHYRNGFYGCDSLILSESVERITFPSVLFFQFSMLTFTIFILAVGIDYANGTRGNFL
jgi:hypothetical protein